MHELSEHACAFAGVVEFVVELVYECPLFGDRAGSRRKGRNKMQYAVHVLFCSFAVDGRSLTIGCVVPSHTSTAGGISPVMIVSRILTGAENLEQ
jgi:hypothetical protein